MDLLKIKQADKDIIIIDFSWLDDSHIQAIISRIWYTENILDEKGNEVPNPISLYDLLCNWILTQFMNVIENDIESKMISIAITQMREQMVVEKTQKEQLSKLS